MAKQHEEKESKEESEVLEQEEKVSMKIGLLTEEFGREDLNKMRDKINEIIARV